MMRSPNRLRVSARQSSTIRNHRRPRRFQTPNATRDVTRTGAALLKRGRALCETRGRGEMRFRPAPEHRSSGRGSDFRASSHCLIDAGSLERKPPGLRADALHPRAARGKLPQLILCLRRHLAVGNSAGLLANFKGRSEKLSSGKA